MDTVEQERFPELLRYHMLCGLPKVRNQRLFFRPLGDLWRGLLLTVHGG